MWAKRVNEHGNRNKRFSKHGGGEEKHTKRYSVDEQPKQGGEKKEIKEGKV